MIQLPQQGNVDIAQILTEHGVEVSTKCSKGDTPIHLAAKKGNYLLILLALHENSNKNNRNKLNQQWLLIIIQRATSQQLLYLFI